MKDFIFEFVSNQDLPKHTEKLRSDGWTLVSASLSPKASSYVWVMAWQRVEPIPLDESFRKLISSHIPKLALDNEPDRGYWIHCTCGWNADGTINGNEEADWVAHIVEGRLNADPGPDRGNNESAG